DDDVESHHLSFQDNVHHAPPGDLLLSTKIAQIIQELDRKQQQSTIVTTLMSRAELLDKPNELRILKKSLSALQREIQLLTYQKQQYERQAEENGSSSVTHSVDLSSLPTPNPSPGPNPPTAHTLYLIEVQQMAPDGANDSGWVVSRRYREFSALHQQLKRRFAVVRNYDFPRKHQLPIIPALWSLTGSRRTQPWPPHVETRRIALEKYLQNITQHIEVCLSYELRQFLPSLRPRLPVPRGGPLSPGTKRQSMGFLNPIQRTIADGLDDILGGPLMLDFISQQLGLQVADLTASEPHTTRGGAGGGALDIHQYLHESGSFIDPLCDLVIETFELKEKSNWLRKQAISILLRNVLGGTIERRIKDSLEALLSPGQLVQHLNTVLHTFWPANQPFTPPAPRSDARKFETQQQASQKWHFFVPNLVGSVVGQRNARRGATRLFNLIQNPYLNENLVCFILDEVVTQVF
ncbi:sorting nexin C terminal-domain-containing protein, partial [Syncephalis pseudoplumigaleata]